MEWPAAPVEIEVERATQPDWTRMNHPTMPCDCGGTIIAKGPWKTMYPAFGPAVCDKCGKRITVHAASIGKLFLTDSEARQADHAAGATKVTE